MIEVYNGKNSKNTDVPIYIFPVVTTCVDQKFFFFHQHDNI